MKLVGGVAVLDAVDKDRLRLDDTATIRPERLSLYVQPLAKLVGPSYRTIRLAKTKTAATMDTLSR
jgi:beta-lactamase class A